jgi:hypothetical protein
MFKLIEFALLCSCSKHNNSICRNNKIQTFSQKIVHVRKYSGAHKISSKWDWTQRITILVKQILFCQNISKFECCVYKVRQYTNQC